MTVSFFTSSGPNASSVFDRAAPIVVMKKLGSESTLLFPVVTINWGFEGVMLPTILVKSASDEHSPITANVTMGGGGGPVLSATVAGGCRPQHAT